MLTLMVESPCFARRFHMSAYIGLVDHGKGQGIYLKPLILGGFFMIGAFCCESIFLRSN